MAAAPEIIEFQSDAYKCSLCLHFLRNPILTKCGHKYCETCIKTWLRNNKTCPLCQQFLKKFDIFVDNHTKRVISDMKQYCVNANRGCSQQASPYEMEEHIKNCPFANCEIVLGNELSLNFDATDSLSIEKSMKQLLEQLNYMKHYCERLFQEMDYRFEMQNQDIVKLRNCIQQIQIDQEARPSAPNQMIEQIEEKLNAVIREQRQMLTKYSVKDYNKSDLYIWTINGVHSKLLAKTVKVVDFNSPIFLMKGPADWNLKLNACLSKASSFGVFYMYPFVRHLGYDKLHWSYDDSTFEAQITITFVHPSMNTKNDWVYIYNHYGGCLSNYISNKCSNLYNYFFQSTSQASIKVDDIINNGFVSDDQLTIKIEVLTF